MTEPAMIENLTAPASVSDVPPVDWTTFDFQSNPNSLYEVGGTLPNTTNNGYIPSQPPSYASFDHFSHLSHPGLTSSSGDLSEVEDFATIARPANLRTTSTDASNEFSSVGDDASEAYRLSNASSYLGSPHANLLASTNLENLNMDDYMGVGKAPIQYTEFQTPQQQVLLQRQQQQQFQAQPMQIFQQSEQHPQQQRPGQSPQQQSSRRSGMYSGMSRNNSGEQSYSIREAQAFAHMNDHLNQQANMMPAMPAVSAGEDPMWSCVQPKVDRSLTLEEDPLEDADWVR